MLKQRMVTSFTQTHAFPRVCNLKFSGVQKTPKWKHFSTYILQWFSNNPLPNSHELDFWDFAMPIDLIGNFGSMWCHERKTLTDNAFEIQFEMHFEFVVVLKWHHCWKWCLQWHTINWIGMEWTCFVRERACVRVCIMISYNNYYSVSFIVISWLNWNEWLTHWRLYGDACSLRIVPIEHSTIRCIVFDIQVYSYGSENFYFYSYRIYQEVIFSPFLHVHVRVCDVRMRICITCVCVCLYFDINILLAWHAYM